MSTASAKWNLSSSSSRTYLKLLTGLSKNVNTFFNSIKIAPVSNLLKLSIWIQLLVNSIVAVKTLELQYNLWTSVVLELNRHSRFLWLHGHYICLCFCWHLFSLLSKLKKLSANSIRAVISAWWKYHLYLWLTSPSAIEILITQLPTSIFHNHS